MAQTQFRVPVDEVEKVMEFLELAKSDNNLDNRQRRSLSLAITALVSASKRSRGNWVLLTEAEMRKVLRCLAELSGLFKTIWLQSFV